jgi:hypothetical protein
LGTRVIAIARTSELPALPRIASALRTYRAARAHPIPEPPMTDRQLYDAMVELSKPR